MKIQSIDVPWLRMAAAFLTGFVLLFGSPLLRADGTETLGPPGIAIAPGTDVIMSGTGLVEGQPGTISFNVPDGATVQQVLIYWEGQDTGAVTGDDDIIVNGNPVTGTLSVVLCSGSTAASASPTAPISPVWPWSGWAPIRLPSMA